MNYIITGDTHSQFSRFKSLGNMPNTAVIILGDAGINYHLDERDLSAKRYLAKFLFTFYCVRGNHEVRPSDVDSMKRIWDDEVSGFVWIEDDFPNIRYFDDWGVYWIDGLRTLVIGGAYSVDKPYRLANGWKWHANEQLTAKEMDECARTAMATKHGFDLILSHTCPRSLQPTDLFLGCIDQSAVDSTMEDWMDRLGRMVEWKHWLFAHYHADRIEWPHVEQFYMEMEPLQDIVERWKKYDETKELDWWLPLSPKMSKIMEGE